MKKKKKHAHGSEVGVVKEAPLSEDSVVAEGAVVMAVVGHHTTETVLLGAGLTHHSVEYLRLGAGRGGERGRERKKREKPPNHLHALLKYKIVFMTEIQHIPIEAQETRSKRNLYKRTTH